VVTEHPESSTTPNVVFTFPTELSKSSFVANPFAYDAPKRVLPLDYILQETSFASAKRAEELRANLILESFQASTLVAKVGAKISYRVVVGPFKRKVEAERIRTALRALRYEPILIPKSIKPEKNQG
jgi:cell division septation protein DedD